jgi:hypothetical protein
MKNLLAIVAILSLMMSPFAAYCADSEPQASNPPPVSQPLAAEGNFAFQLVTALKLGTPTTEAQAEDILTSAGIAPTNGWIADYPMTPIVVGQVQDALVAAAESKKLPMGKDEALKTFQGLMAEFDLALAPATEYPAQAERPTSSEYVQPTEVDNYYNQEGPPVITYYPPPWDYGYLYTWVPYPFFWTGFFFPGFFVLNDFDVVVVRDHFGHHFHHDFDHHGHDFDHRITNHFRDPRTHDFRRVDPTTRTAGMGIHGSSTRMAGLTSPEVRKSAESIFHRSVRTSESAGLAGASGRRFGRVAPRTADSRTFSQPGNTGRPFAGAGRTFKMPAHRSFRMSSQGFARSFSPPSRSFGAPSMSRGSSFGGFHRGGFRGFHSGGSFSGGFHGGGGGFRR